MALSRTTRISILLAIDIVFFLIEIIVGVYFDCCTRLLVKQESGYAVGSLALVADSFHMLKYALMRYFTPQITHGVRQRCGKLGDCPICDQGMHYALECPSRAECHFSLLHKHIPILDTPMGGTGRRFWQPSSTASFFWHSASLSSWRPSSDSLVLLVRMVTRSRGNISSSFRGRQPQACRDRRLLWSGVQCPRSFLIPWCELLPLLFLFLSLTLCTEHGHSHSHSHGSKPNSATPSKAASIASDEDATLGERPTSPPQYRAQSQTPQLLRKTRERSESYSSLYGHPAATRASLVQTAADMARERSPQPVGPRRTRSHSRPLSSVESQRSFGAGSSSQSPLDGEEEDTGAVTPTGAANERTALLSESHDHDHGHDHVEDPSDHGHSSSHGHAHGSMNMRGILLHVLGDALGNVGVIATGLIIWLTTWSFRFYCDPIISLVITVIIFQSALPLGMLSAYDLHLSC